MKVKEIKSDDIKSLAIKNALEYAKSKKIKTSEKEVLENTVLNSFRFTQTKEGAHFWNFVISGEEDKALKLLKK